MGRTKNHLLPLIPLRGITVFPLMSFSFDVGRASSIRAIEEAVDTGQNVFLTSQKDPKTEDPKTADEIHEVGVIVEIKQILKITQDLIRVLGEGVGKAKIIDMNNTGAFITVKVKEFKNLPYDETEYTDALLRTAVELYEEYARLSMTQASDSIYSVVSSSNLHEVCDLIASNISVRFEKKQEILGMTDACEKMDYVIHLLDKENSVLEIQRGIYKKVRTRVEKNQKEYYLREQLKVIRDELGDKEENTEADEYKEKIKSLNLIDASNEKLMKDLDRFRKLQSNSSEYSVMCTYFDTLLELPWNIKTKDSRNLEKAETILERDHYGLAKVKERVIEYLAVRLSAKKGDVPILCFVGAPGTGKTSVAKSIAEALGRKYVRMSLGGVNDEAEIRGHRKTYVGAMPGRIINAIRQAKSSNPLILLDEIDKLSKDYKGDPSSALLEVLDTEQNFSFRDHYLEIPYDLSDTIFISTANRADTIPPALKDRLEIIEVSGYTEDEKTVIAEKHLFPKQLKKHGLTRTQLKISKEVYSTIINGYTKEAGVRQLERNIAKICRKCVLSIEKKEKKTIGINNYNLENYLGIPKYKSGKKEEKPIVGVAKGLAWTAYGGDTLSIEVNTMKGTGKFVFTGNMGDIMKESARAAISYIRSNAAHFNIDEQFYKETDIHIHIPEGAVPKDGPSAGITMAAAIVSSLTGTPVSNDIAMTGEITIRGNVLPVGGMKEKLLAAKRSGITKIAAPIDNKKDIEEIPTEVINGLSITYVEYMEQVLNEVLEGEKRGE
jgi:ATP-dependent Lon protease